MDRCSVPNHSHLLPLKSSSILLLSGFQIWWQESKLKAARMNIYVRRGGPNYQTGLAKMRTLGAELGVPIEVWTYWVLTMFFQQTLAQPFPTLFIRIRQRLTLLDIGHHWTIPMIITDELNSLNCRYMDQRQQ